MEVTRRLAELVACIRSEAIAAEARLQARRAILDTMGVALAGSGEESSRIIAEVVREQGGREEATVVGHRFRAPATETALANGTAAHALDYDDVQVNMRGHPSAPLLPAVLALGEKLGASGRETIEAFVVGFEVECKLGRALGGSHYELGWHATSTLGTVGAAAASARLLRLDVGRTQTALGIAASLASGLQQNFGTMTKPLHAGWAARNGVIAATLAQRGFSAAATALEGESGLLRAMSGGAEIDSEEAVQGLGQPWEIVSPGIGVKLYPCCYATHRAIDAALEIRQAYRAHSSNIERIEVTVSPGTLVPLQRRRPETGLEAKFSMEYCVATALTEGGPGLAAFTDEAASRPEIRELMGRVCVREGGTPAAFPIGGRAEVSVRTVGGQNHTRQNHTRVVETPRGDPQNPLSWEKLAEKFRGCATVALMPERTEEAMKLIDRLDYVADIRELVSVVAS